MNNEEMSEATQQERIEQLERVQKIGVALSAERDRPRLLEMILLEAKNLCHADGGTLYLRTDDDHLKFTIMRTDSLNIALGGTTGKEINIPPLAMMDPESGEPNHHNVATHTAFLKKMVHIPDAYNATGFDFSGAKNFDEKNNYRSTSFLNVPLVNSKDRVIGVLQLLNARNPNTNALCPFPEEHQRIVAALSSQAAVALDNQMLMDEQKELLESFIKMMASAIDAKSPYTGKHCERVPILTEMIAKEACDAVKGPLKDFVLSEEKWYELHIAAWLHDCGKVVTPVHVMDKATKLETINDRIELVKTRFAIACQGAETDYWKNLAQNTDTPEVLKRKRDARLKELEDDLAFLETANTGGEFIRDEDRERIQAIGQKICMQNGQETPLLNENEVYNLTIARGTLTNEERLIINGHMVETIKMLEALPFPRNLRRVPEYAGGHHEKMDGRGYPKGLFAGDMSIPARIMAIADVFEALTAADRPYKKGKTLSEAIKIMGFMKKDNHLDPELFDLFITSGVYKDYAQRFLPDNQIDDVDEAAALNMQPGEFELPSKEERNKCWQDFLEEYQNPST